MSNLKVVDIYEKLDVSRVKNFNDNLRSTLHVNTVYDKVEGDFEWLEMMEETIRYLDNILRNPNRFIVNEEEIVKIELARRITVESIRHLSRNTNFIQDINEKGEVMPSKIMNINKEENFETYENRFVYTLIKRMRDFILLKKRENLADNSLKDFKKFEYQAKSKIGQEQVNISLMIDSKIDSRTASTDDSGLTVADRIEKMEAHISMLTNTDVFLTLKKKNVADIIPPIKKTNLILKNTNFQYAIRLWDYLQNNIESKVKRVKDNKSYEDTGILKEYVNDTFLLNYVALATLGDESAFSEKKKEMIEEITNNMIERIVELNANLSEEDLKDIIGEKILMVRTKTKASLSEIQGVFTRQIKNYLEKIENFKFESEA